MITGRARTSQGGVDKPTLSGGGSERVHVSEQTVDLLLIQHLSKAVHLGPPEFDNVSDPLIIGGKAADAQVRVSRFRSYAVALFRVSKPHFCLRQHGTCRSSCVRFFRAERGKSAHN